MPVPFLSKISYRVTKRALAGDAPRSQRKADETLRVLRVPAAKKTLYYHGNDKVVAGASWGLGNPPRRHEDPKNLPSFLCAFVSSWWICCSSSNCRLPTVDCLLTGPEA